MEQDNLYKGYLPTIQANKTTGGSILDATINGQTGKDIPPPPYLKCPSDELQAWKTMNYVGSMGPQYVDAGCGYNPYISFANGSTPGIPDTSANNYGGTPFGGPGSNEPPPASQVVGVFNRAGVQLSLVDISDGLSNTIFVGEWKPQWMAEGIWPYWEGYGSADKTIGHWTVFKGGAAYGSTLAPINYRTDDVRSCAKGDPTRSVENAHLSFGFKSSHTGGCNFVFGDGSVHFLSESINQTMYQYLGCRFDGQVVDASQY